MAEQEQEQQDEGKTTAGTENGGESQEPDPAAQADHWKQQARKWEQRAKENKDAATKLKEFEDAQKSEQEKITERAETAEKRAAEAEQRAMRSEVAAAKGLTLDQAARLQGATVEELEADADKLKALFAPKEDDEPDLRRRPRERLKGGALPSAEPEENDPMKLAEGLPRRW